MAPRTADTSAETILHAASTLLAEEGPSALTVRRIAAAAGGSTMNVYSRFGGKDGVLDALYVEGFTWLGDAMRRVRTTSDPLADLTRCGRAYRSFALAHPTHYELMFDRYVPGYEPSPDAKAAAIRALSMLADRVRKAMDADQLRHGDPMATATVIWAAQHGPVSLELKSAGPPDTNWEGVHRVLTQAIINGLA